MGEIGNDIAKRGFPTENRAFFMSDFGRAPISPKKSKAAHIYFPENPRLVSLIVEQH